ncbi:MAG: hypothetical protein H6739_36815 [Alphaproteobacteria bacterium]|nr:hypothetical protein [Alphaproteobacteria bacterium]
MLRYFVQVLTAWNVIFGVSVTVFVVLHWSGVNILDDLPGCMDRVTATLMLSWFMALPFTAILALVLNIWVRWRTGTVLNVLLLLVWPPSLLATFF